MYNNLMEIIRKIRITERNHNIERGNNFEVEHHYVDITRKVKIDVFFFNNTYHYSISAIGQLIRIIFSIGMGCQRPIGSVLLR